MKNASLWPLILPLFALPAPCHAFGLGDVIGAAIHAGTELGSAAVGKAVDSFRDPEAEKAKQKKQEDEIVQKMNKALDDVEARSDLTPLQRERLCLTIKEQYANAISMTRFAAEAEARQRAERDNVFTAQGLAGVAGRSVASMPSVTMAQADAMVKTGIPQRETNNTLSRIDNNGNVSPGQGLSAQQVNQTATQVSQAMGQAVDAQRAEMADITRKIAADNPAKANSASEKPTFFSADKGHKLYVEFVKSNKLTALIRDGLQAKGYALVDKQGDAEVVYLFDGEYRIYESSLHEGAQEEIGVFYDNPHEVADPEEKTSGKARLLLTKGLLALGGAQNQAPSTPIYRQDVLIVASRKPVGGKETRVSSFLKEENDMVRVVGLMKDAMNELMDKVGMDHVALRAVP